VSATPSIDALNAHGKIQTHSVLGHCHANNRWLKLTLMALGFADLGLGRYDGAPACVFEVRRSDWLRVRDLPRKAQKRAGLLQLRSQDALPQGAGDHPMMGVGFDRPHHGPALQPAVRGGGRACCVDGGAALVNRPFRC
jgi:hypothetical protein